MKTKEAKKYLMQLKKLDLLIENKMAEKAHWISIATNTTANTSGEKVQSTSNPQKMEAAVCRYVDMEREIDACIDRFVDAKKEIISVIEQLPPDEYDLLHKVYVQYKSLKEVSALYVKSYNWATTVHGTALKHVSDIIEAKKS